MMMKHLSGIGIVLLLNAALGSAFADVVVVVSERSPVTTLTRSQLTDIYLGRAYRFPNGENAIPIDQAEGSEARGEFYSDYMGRSSAQIKTHWSKLIFTGRGQPPRSMASDTAVMEFVVENPNAIGYVDHEYVNDELRIVSIE